MKRNHLFPTLLTIGLLLSACGGNDHSRHVSEKVRDHDAYELGQEHARVTIAVRFDESALQDRLLDVKARISNIDSKMGPQSAHDYETGFRDYINENCDSLARIIF